MYEASTVSSRNVPTPVTIANRSKVPQDLPRSTTVSISTAERWEKELLADAKVAPFFSTIVRGSLTSLALEPSCNIRFNAE